MHGESSHRSAGVVHMAPKRAVMVLAVTTVLLNVSLARPSLKAREQEASCDWKQSGLTQSPPRGVLPVYLGSCDSGTVRWNHPQEALRIVLRAAHGPPEEHRQSFQTCFRLEARSAGALVHLETAEGDLVPGPGDRAMCVLSSREGSVVVYAVAIPLVASSSWAMKKRRQLALTYTTGQPVASFERLECWEECRPCTETKLRDSYCTSDLAKCPNYVNKVPWSQRVPYISHPTLSTLQVRQQMFWRWTGAPTVAAAKVRDAVLDADKRSIRWLLSVSRNHRGLMPEYVTRPARCGFPRDTQEPHLVISRWHLGHPVVTCAPKLTQWQRLQVQGKLVCTFGTDDADRQQNT